MSLEKDNLVLGGDLRALATELDAIRNTHATSGASTTNANKTELKNMVIDTSSPKEGEYTVVNNIENLKNYLKNLYTYSAYITTDYSNNITTPVQGEYLKADLTDVLQTQINTVKSICCHDSAYYSGYRSHNSSFYSGYKVHNSGFNSGYRSHNSGFYSGYRSHNSSNRSFRMSWGSFSGSGTGTCNTYRGSYR